MTTGGQHGWVSYPMMVDYVDRVTKPLEQHMSAHDAWHLERATAEEQANRAVRLAAWGIAVSLLGVIAMVIVAIVFRH